MKILLADDHAMMRDGLKAIFEKRAGAVVVGEASTGREAISLSHSLRPDVVVMDIDMPELNGIDATRRLSAELPDVRVIALSLHTDRRYVTAMFGAGAVAYLLKDGSAAEFLKALDEVAEGRSYVSPAISSEGELPAMRGVSPRELSAREREVLQLVAEGKASKEIAATLSIALPTVETHRRQIMTKLELRTIAELTKYAIRIGLTTVDT